MLPKAGVDVTRIATAPTVPGAVPPPIPSTPEAAFVPPVTVPPVTPPGVMPPVTSVAEVPPVVPPAVAGAPGVTITPAPGEVPVPPDLAGAPPAVMPPVTPVTAVPPVVTTPELIEPGENTPAGEAVTQVTGAHNIAVKEIADTQAQNLQAASAPKTAQAIQQLAQ